MSITLPRPRAGANWAAIVAQSTAISKKALKEGEVSFTRAAVGWCYGQLGMVEEALNHYRIAHERHKHPIISIGLAYAEFNFGNVKESRALVRKVRESGKEIPAGYLEDLQELEELIAASENQGQVEPGAKVS